MKYFISKSKLLFILYCFSSCNLISIGNGQLVQGYNSGYQLLSDEQEKTIHFLSDSQYVDNALGIGKIYAIHASHLQNFLKSNPKTLVYLWSPHCTSDGCIRIGSCQEYATANGYDLIVIADYYDMQMMQKQNLAKLPILIANHQYYKSNISKKYNTRFWADFGLDKYPNTIYQKYARFLFFEKDKLVKTKIDLFK